MAFAGQRSMTTFQAPTVEDAHDLRPGSEAGVRETAAAMVTYILISQSKWWLKDLLIHPLKINSEQFLSHTHIYIYIGMFFPDFTDRLLLLSVFLHPNSG